MTATLTDRLDGIEQGWLTEEFVEALHRRERLREAAQNFEMIVSSAEAERDAAVAAVAAGEPDADQWLLRACTAVHAANAARAALPAPQLSDDAVRPPVNSAGLAIDYAARHFTLKPLALRQDVAAWRLHCRQHRVVLDPPIGSDAERNAEQLIDAFERQTEAWHATRHEWVRILKAGHRTEPLDLLGAAAELVRQADAFIDQAARINAVIEALNEDRERSGRRWVVSR